MIRLSIFLSLTACLPQVNGIEVQTPVPTPTPAPATSVEVTADGGRFVLDGGVIVDIPAGAAQDPFVLDVSVHPDGVPTPYVGRSEHLVFGPTGTTFATPVTIVIPYEGADDVELFWFDDTGLTSLEDVVFADGTATFSVSTLSSGFVALPLPRSVDVPADGGAFDLSGGVTVDVPAGASAQPFTLSVERLADGVPPPYVGLSDHFAFLPADLALDAPLQITLPFAGPDEDARVYWADGTGGFAQVLDADVVNGRASFLVDTLRTGFVAEPITTVDVPVGGGRFVFDGGVVLTIPAESVELPFTLTVAPGTTGTPLPASSRTPLYTFDSPVDLAAGATLEVPFTGANDDLRAWVDNGDGGWAQLANTFIADNVATVDLSSLPEALFLAPNGPVDEVFELDPPTPVDVLIVIDDSCSMAEQQAKLATGFQAFFSSVEPSGIDYHVGVTTTDTDINPNAGLLRSHAGQRYISQFTVDPNTVLAAMVTAGTNGSFDERGRHAAWLALDANATTPANAGFLRQDADLHLLFVSDEDDYSVLPARADFRQWLTGLKQPPYTATSHAITDLPGVPCPEAFDVGQEYVTYANWTGGMRLGLCTPSWAPFLRRFGQRVVGQQALFRTVHPITPGTVTVSVEDAAGNLVVFAPDTYVVDDDTVTLDAPVDAGSIVRIAYTPE